MGEGNAPGLPAAVFVAAMAVLLAVAVLSCSVPVLLPLLVFLTPVSVKVEKGS